MASFHHRVKSGKKGTAAQHAAYIARQGSFESREDLIASGCGNLPGWAEGDPVKFWRNGDKYERANGAVYREHEVALPAELTDTQAEELVGAIIQEIAGEKLYQYAVHANTSTLEGNRNPHMHLMYSDRIPDGIERPPQQTFARYNPNRPEVGGCKKDSGGKNALEMRISLIEVRRKCAELQNTVLEKYGHTARVVHRTLRQQGIHREPERHLGQAKVRMMSAEEKGRYVAKRLFQSSLGLEKD